MWIAKVEIKNFKLYRETSVDFPLGLGPNNIFLLTGENNNGKTSFLDAIKWGLYGDTPKKTFKDFMNDRCVKSGKPFKTSVRILFDHNGEIYDLERIAEPDFKSGRAEDEIELIIGGIKRVIDKQDEIEDVLPKDISDFFLFDGEDIRNLVEAQKQQTIKGKIEEILGLIDIKTSIRHLSELKDEINDEIDNTIGEVETNLGREIEEKKRDLEEKEKEIKKIEDKIEDLEREKNYLDKKIDDLGLKKVKESREKKNEYKKREEKLKKEIENLKEDLEKVRNYSYLFILEDKIRKLRDKLSKESKSIIPNKNEIIDRSIEAKFCVICERKLTEEVRKKFNEFKSEPKIEYDPWDDSKTLEKALNHLENLKKDKSTPDGIKEAIRRKRVKKNDLDDSIKKIEALINKEARKKDEEIAHQKEKLDKEIRIKEQKIGEMRSKKENVKGKLEELRKKYSKAKSKSEEQKSLEEQIKFINECIEKLETLREKAVKKERENIKKATWDKFKEIWAGEEYKDVEFKTEKNYEFQLIEKDDTKPNMDQLGNGAKEIMAISFILGLNEYSGLEAPIIMNATLDPLDTNGRENLVNFLGNLDEQVILLVLGSNLEAGDTKEILSKNIAQEYKISKKGFESNIEVVK